MLPSGIIFHQALFGYDNGHNLLASSCELTSDSRRMLAPLTDATGPWPANGFDQTYTGVPLPDMPYFALFCTWSAPEMHRPGCVWSHVLLIDLTDLAGIENLADIKCFFRRPVKNKEKPYKIPIPFSKQTERENSEKSFFKYNAEEFLTGLYANPETCFVKETSRSFEFEDLIFAIWSQQWPKLRRNFRFSTGSFADRSRLGAPFDLQLMPIGTLRILRREEKTSEPKIESQRVPVLDRPWFTIALDDLCEPNATGLRLFLSNYGADIEGLRNVFTRLVTIFNHWRLKSELRWTDKFHLIADLFPKESDAVRLKEESLLVTDSPTFDMERAWETALFLLNAKEARAFSKVSFDHHKLAPRLWQRNKFDVLDLLARLVRRKESSVVLSFATAVANTIEPSELQIIFQDHPELIPILLGKRPSLAFDIKVWKLPDSIQWQIHEVLDKLSLSEMDWSKILAAKFIAATGVAVRETVRMAGDHAIEGAFMWLRADLAGELLPSQIWREAMEGPAAKKLALAEMLSPQELAFCAWFVESDIIRKTLSADRADVRQLAQAGLDILPQPLRLPTAFLLVTLGLSHPDPGAVKLILQGYFQVYEALSKTSFPWESWVLLSSELPPWNKHWPEWDRCERLRRGVRNWLLKHFSHGQLLLDAAPDAKRKQIARETLTPDETRECID